MITVRDLWRYPIKGIGREPVTGATLTEGATFPGDRIWAVAHDAAKLEPEGWSRCGNFARAAKAPSLMAITSQTGPDGQITLTHPDRPSLTLSLPTDDAALRDWLAPLYPDNRPPLAQTVTAAPRGMTDSAFASISIMNHASRRALEQKAGVSLAPERFRGNIWIDGAAPWEEFDWVGKTLTIGGATLRVEEPITRCLATHANPETGQRDIDTLTLLERDWGHQEFGVNAVVLQGGDIAIGDTVTR